MFRYLCRTSWSITFLLTTLPVYAQDQQNNTYAMNPVDTKDKSIINPAIRSALEGIAHNYIVDIKGIFKQACFDCHTSLTEYPWYYSLPGVKDKIDSDIEKGREHLDFSNDYPFLSQGEISDDLKSIARTIKEQSMPPISYKVMHFSKKLTKEQKEKVLQWVEQSLVQLNNAGYVASTD